VLHSRTGGSCDSGIPASMGVLSKRRSLAAPLNITRTTMRLASPEDFFNGPVYTCYRHHEGYRKRALLLHPFPDPILIVGCGWGFLVDELHRLDHTDCWGIDASDYAIANRVHKQVVKADMLDPPLSHFSTAVTEDLLPCLTDEEAAVAAINCASIAPIVIHLVTEHGQGDLNYHSTAEWLRLTGQITVSLEGM
jgi:hypothetical protein